MALKPVQDPAVLAALSAPQPAGPRPVSDPALLAQLNAGAAPNTTDRMVGGRINPDYVPQAADLVPAPPPDSGNMVSRFWDEITNDPILNMWGHGLTTIAKGAPEAIPTVINNLLVQGAAGLTAPFLAQDDNDAANFIRDFTGENLYTPRGDSAQQVVEGLGDAFAPLGNVKQALGETTLDLTGSPFAATMADLAPDVALTIAGGRVPGGRVPDSRAPSAAKPVRDARGLAGDELGDALAGGQRSKLDSQKPTPVTEARKAGFQVRPSDAERIGVKTPGKFREKLAPTDARRDFTLKNQENANKLAAEEIGVPEGARLDDASFKAVKQPHFDTYNKAESVAKRGPVTPEFAELLVNGVKEAKFKAGSKPSVTETISALRTRARKAVQSQDIATQDYGETLLDLANNIEDAFGKHLEAVGAPEMLTAYREARKSLAKINDVEQATRAGQIDPAIIFKRGEKGSQLSGRLKMIAETFENFPDVTNSTMSSAGRAAVKEPSIAGMVKDAVTGTLRKIPGLGDVLDIRSQGFQNRLGREATPTERTYFDSDPVAPDPVETPQITRQEDMLGSAFEFEAPGGAVGRLPPKPMPTDQIESLGTMLDLEMPPGTAPANPKRTISQQTEEFQPFMDLVPPPGKVGRPARKSSAKATELTPEEVAYIRQFLGE